MTDGTSEVGRSAFVSESLVQVRQGCLYIRLRVPMKY